MRGDDGWRARSRTLTADGERRPGPRRGRTRDGAGAGGSGPDDTGACRPCRRPTAGDAPGRAPDAPAPGDGTARAPASSRSAGEPPPRSCGGSSSSASSPCGRPVASSGSARGGSGRGVSRSRSFVTMLPFVAPIAMIVLAVNSTRRLPLVGLAAAADHRADRARSTCRGCRGSPCVEFAIAAAGALTAIAGARRAISGGAHPAGNVARR